MTQLLPSGVSDKEKVSVWTCSDLPIFAGSSGLTNNTSVLEGFASAVERFTFLDIMGGQLGNPSKQYCSDLGEISGCP